MGELLKHIFELSVKKRWLKTIDKECDKYNKLRSKLSRQQLVIKSLLERFVEIYGEELRNQEKGGAE